MVKSQSASNSPVTNKEFDSNNSSQSKLKKKKHKKLKSVLVDNFNLEDDPSRLMTSSLRNLTGMQVCKASLKCCLLRPRFKVHE